MKNNHSYRLPALLLAVVMMIGILPVAAFAGNEFIPTWNYSYTAQDAAFTYASDGNEVSGVEELVPNKASTMTVKVPGSNGLPNNTNGEILVNIPANITVTAEAVKACQSDDVTCSYRASKNQLVFKWKGQAKQDAGFTATISVAPDLPSTVELGGRYVVTTVKKDQTQIGAMKAKTRDNNRLVASVITTYAGKMIFDDNSLYQWTFARVSGDWYTISNNGLYLKMNKNALALTDRSNATVFHIKKEAYGYVIESDGYYLNTKSDNASNGMQGSNWDPMAQWVKLYPTSELFDPNVGGQGYIKLSANGGNKAISNDMISADIDSTITLPEYKGTKNNKQFIGWALYSNIYENHDGNNSSYCEVYLPGTQFKVPAGLTNLYAVYNEKGTKVRFGFRKDGTIPHEPANYTTNEYTGHMEIENALKVGKWVVDVDGNKPVEGNHIANEVAANLSLLPTDEQIKATMKNYDPETMYIHWYVLKYASQWKVDGVIRTRQSNTIAYNVNIEGEDRNYIVDMPSGFELAQQATVKAGAVASGTVKTPALPGYEFLGWNTEADGSGTAYTTGDDIEVKGSVTLYAQWRKLPKYAVTYKLENAAKDAVIPESITYLEGGKVTLADAEKRKGYIFSGWKVNGVEIEGNTFIMPDREVEITGSYYGPIDVDIRSDWPIGKAGYLGAKITLTAEPSAPDGVNLDYAYQWQYKDSNDNWVDLPGATGVTITYELNEETSNRIWRVIITDAWLHQD